ncbi:MAG: TraR/DksA C4-type zinc finger protein [Candidatus Peregrinibacteria bacterium]
MGLRKAELKAYQEKLVLLQRSLVGDTSSGIATAEELFDDAETAARTAQATLLEINGHQVDTLALIDAALERIEEGEFGNCIECEARIPKTRLNAIPYTPHCMKCAGRVQEGRPD